MSDPPPPPSNHDPGDRQPPRRPLPHILPARTKLPTSASQPSPSSQSQSSSSGSWSGSGSGSGSNTAASSYKGASRSSRVSSRVSSAALSSTPSSVASVALPPRKPLTRVACEACRRRRTKCDGGRPKCAACLKHRSECIYSSNSATETNSQALKRRFEETEDEKNVYKQLYENLHTLPEDQALEIVRRIRMGATIASIVSQIEDGDLLLQMSLVPETRLRYDFPYRTAMPLVIQQSNSPYLGSHMYDAIYADCHLQQESGTGGDQTQRWHNELRELVTKYPPQYLRPYHAARLVDSRLGAVDVTKWTNVITDNNLFVSLLSAYLLREYPGFAVFHKDTFLQALVDGDKRFCSPLLVNALMAEACHCYYVIPNRLRYWDPLNLGYRFLAEAKRLWELRTEPYTLVHAQAATLLNLVYSHNGLDQIGLPYLEEAIEIGRTIGIFGSAVLVEDQDFSHARLFTAWAIFRWTVLLGHHFQRPGIMEAPPEVPLPSPEEQPKLYGELYLQYPLVETLVSTDFGSLFKAWASLRVIINEIAFAAFHNGNPPAVPADRWLAFRQQLEAWFVALPVSLSPKNVIWPALFAMHMEYHIVLIALSRMHILEATKGSPTGNVVSLVASAHEAAGETLAHASIQFETVMRLYYLRHSFEYCDTYLTHSLNMLCNMVMESRASGCSSQHADASEHLRSTLVLSLKGLADQGRHIYITAVIFKLLCDRQTPDDLNLLGTYVGLDNLENRSTFEERVHSAYPLETSTANNPEPSRLENIVRGQSIDD